MEILSKIWKSKFPAGVDFQAAPGLLADSFKKDGELQVKPAPGQGFDITVRKCSLTLLPTLLSQAQSVQVVDKTGLTGEYDFTLSWDETNAPALSTAVQEQPAKRKRCRYRCL
jgi:uncharacterized protein (TIGR03435 family)